MKNRLLSLLALLLLLTDCEDFSNLDLSKDRSHELEKVEQ